MTKPTLRYCPICGFNDGNLLYDGGRGKKFDIIICTKCGLVYVPNLSHQAGAYRIRNNEDLSPERIAGVLESERRAYEMAERRFKNLDKQAPEVLELNGRMHDIGASLGLFMNFWHKIGFEVTGCEPDKYYAKIGKKHFGFDIAPCLYEQRPVEIDAYDLITICHVLEHVPYPRDILKRIRTELKNGGKLYIEIPQISRPYSGNLDRFFWVEHLNYFSLNTLDGLLRSEGFRIAKNGELGFFLWAIVEKGPYECIINDLPLDSPDETLQRVMISMLHHQTRKVKELENKISDITNESN